MLVECIAEEGKVTASRTFEYGKKYDVRSVDAEKGLKAKVPYFKLASKAESDKFYAEKQGKAHNADKIKEIQANEKKGIKPNTGKGVEAAALANKAAELEKKSLELDEKLAALDEKLAALDEKLAATDTPPAAQ